MESIQGAARADIQPATDRLQGTALAMALGPHRRRQDSESARQESEEAMTKVSVDAEIDLAWDVKAEDLAEALIESVGRDRALRMVATSRPDKKGKYSVLNATDEMIDVIESMRAAFAEIDAGRAEKGMRALRLLCAEQLNLSQWESVKNGTHPFLRLPA